MTQILTVLRRTSIFHLSDRLLTEQNPNSSTADRRSNKALLVMTPRSTGIVAYAGYSRVRGVLTDDWLAGVICSDPDDSQLREPNAAHLNHLLHNEVARRIESRLQQHLAFLTATPRSDFEMFVQYSGYWADAERRTVPFVFEFVKRQGQSELHRKFRRDFGEHHETEHVIASPPLSKSAGRALEQDLQMLRGSPAGVGEALLRAMQAASARPTVGDAFLEVHIGSAARQEVSLGFISANEGTFDYLELAENNHEGYYIPWILSHGGILAPSVANFPTLNLGPDIRIDIPQVATRTGPIALFLEPQDRTPTTDADGIKLRSEGAERMNADIVATQRLNTLIASHLLAVKHCGRISDSAWWYLIPDLPESATAEGRDLGTGLATIYDKAALVHQDLDRRIFVGAWSDSDIEEMLNGVMVARERQSALDVRGAFLRSVRTECNVTPMCGPSDHVEGALTIVWFEPSPGIERSMLRIDRALQLASRHADDLGLAIHLSKDAVEQCQSLSGETMIQGLIELGFERTPFRSEPFRRLPRSVE